MKRFQCYSAKKSLVGGGGGIAIIATSSRSRSLIRDLRWTLDLDPSLTIRLSKQDPIYKDFDKKKLFQKYHIQLVGTHK